MSEFILFLTGRYSEKSLVQFKRLCKGRKTVAVDGGYKFFEKFGLRPDYLIGDMDSIGKIRKKVAKSVTVIEHPVAKDKTDSELAVEFALKAGAEAIDIIDPTVGQIDHFLGNMMLLVLINRTAPETQARIVSQNSQILLLDNSSASFEKCQGEAVSILPFEKEIRLSCSGTAFDTVGCKIAPGQGRGLRNTIRSAKAEFEVKEKAFLIHRF